MGKQPLVGTGRPAGTYIELGHHVTLGALRAELLPVTLDHPLTHFDAAAVRLTTPRLFTQEGARLAFEQTESGQQK
jgi:hypothetical protein